MPITVCFYDLPMRVWLLGGAITLCLFSLWAIGRYDWLRLTRPARRVLAEVTGYRPGNAKGGRTYAAIYRFADEAGTHEVIDAVFSTRQHPPIGSFRQLTYPVGHPQLARPPRPLLWVAVYLGILTLLGLLVARAIQWWPLN